MGWQKTILVTSLAIAILTLPVSMSLCHGALVIYMIAWGCEGRWREKAELLRGHPFIWVFVVFLLLHVIGISYSEDIANGWFNVEKKLFFFLLPAIFATTLSLDKKTIQLAFKAFIFTCVVTTLYCLAAAFYQTQTSQTQNNFDHVTLSLYQQLNPEANFSWMFFSYIELASRIGMHPTYLALYLVFSVLLLIHLFAESFISFRPVKKVGIILLFFYLEIIIVLLSSRIIILAFAIITITGLIYILGFLKVKPVLQTVIVTMVLGPILFILLFNPVTRYRNIQEPAAEETYLPSEDGIYSYSTGIRKSLWMLGLSVIRESNPVIGVGTGDVKVAMKEMSQRSGLNNILHSYDPHNQFLYTQIGLGIVGLMMLLICLYFPIWTALRHKNYFYLGFMLIFTLVSATESVLESQKGIVFFAIFNSMLVFPYSKLSMTSLKKLAYG